VGGEERRQPLKLGLVAVLRDDYAACDALAEQFFSGPGHRARRLAGHWHEDPVGLEPLVPGQHGVLFHAHGARDSLSRSAAAGPAERSLRSSLIKTF
jgi:hypothetical protein